MNLIAELEAEQIAALGKDIPDFKAGDTVRVGYKVTEGHVHVFRTTKVFAFHVKMALALLGHSQCAKSLSVKALSVCSHCIQQTSIASLCTPWPRTSCQAILSSFTSR